MSNEQTAFPEWIRKEYILCAAIWYNNEIELNHSPYGVRTGFVLCGHRHHQIIELYFSMTGKQTTELHTEQGFLTSGNSFVTRERAARIAYECGQIKEGKHKLFSEDIY